MWMTSQYQQPSPLLHDPAFNIRVFVAHGPPNVFRSLDQKQAPKILI
jgi:hypothetical protein